MPSFLPVRVRGGRWRSGAARRRHRPAVAAGLILTAAALVAAVPSPGTRPSGVGGGGHERAQAPPGERLRAPLVSAPVRIADAEAVRLLRPGDRVDVVAARADGGPGVRTLASGVRVVSVPRSAALSADVGETPAGGGALVVLRTERATAARLAGAGVTSRLAVVLW
ncbi:hypothetical protein J3486_35195 [Streptomyces sp. VRA16 Mangrove soil]|nr:hypothetical protein [Streptomyces sp. VRA16 Mangrove soil]